jgi:aminoglycoside/choline kinase family phosphotransferase
MAERAAEIAVFLRRAGWGDAARAPLPGDASFRRYERLTAAGRRAVLMDAPPPKENVRPYLAVARHLRALGFGAPAIYAADEDAGLLVIEDLGDATFTRLLAEGADAAALYALAVDALAALHRRADAAPDWLPPYDDARLLAEAELLTGWYMPAIGKPPSPAQVRDYRALWQAAFPTARAVPETLVLRDYHVDNLMLLPGRDGLAALGLLDFQDAVRGPVSYDLMSLLEDARRDVPDALQRPMRARYLAAFPALDPAAFDASLAALGAQRHAKVIGIFTRLCVRDGKPAYLAHIPRVFRLLERALAHPALGALRDWFDAALPPDARVVPRRPAA